MHHLVEMVVFAKVVESRGFSAAARHLGMTTSAVSRSVARLEEHMGARLLNRTTRAMTVTEFGRDVYSGCARIASTAHQIQSLAGEYANSPRGLLRISAPIVYGQTCLVPQLSTFLADWPEVSVQLDLTDRMVDLVTEGFDVAVRIATSLPPGVVARSIGTMTFILAATPEYLEENGEPEHPRDLGTHTCISFGSAQTSRELVLTREDEEEVVQVRSRLTINNSAAIVTALAQDFAVGLVPDFAAAEALAAGHLRRVLPAWSSAGANKSVPISVVYTPTRHLPPKVRAFIDHLLAARDKAPRRRQDCSPHRSDAVPAERPLMATA